MGYLARYDYNLRVGDMRARSRRYRVRIERLVPDDTMYYVGVMASGTTKQGYGDSAWYIVHRSEDLTNVVNVAKGIHMGLLAAGIPNVDEPLTFYVHPFMVATLLDDIEEL